MGGIFILKEDFKRFNGIYILSVMALPSYERWSWPGEGIHIIRLSEERILYHEKNMAYFTDGCCIGIGDAGAERTDDVGPGDVES